MSACLWRYRSTRGVSLHERMFVALPLDAIEPCFKLCREPLTRTCVWPSDARYNMFKILLPAAAALGLVAFAAQSQGAASEPEMSQPVMSWTLHSEGDLAKLAYGVPNSDQLALMVACAPGDRMATVYGDVQIEAAQVLQASYGARPLDPLSGGLADEATISINDPSLQRLAERGRVTVVGDAGRFELTAGEEERRLVGDFLTYCGAGRA